MPDKKPFANWHWRALVTWHYGITETDASGLLLVPFSNFVQCRVRLWHLYCSLLTVLSKLRTHLFLVILHGMTLALRIIETIPQAENDGSSLPRSPRPMARFRGRLGNKAAEMRGLDGQVK